VNVVYAPKLAIGRPNVLMLHLARARIAEAKAFIFPPESNKK
jgi:hypothetical protein